MTRRGTRRFKGKGRKVGRRRKVRTHAQRVAQTRLTIHQRTNFIPPTALQIANANSIQGSTPVIPTNMASTTAFDPASGTIQSAFVESVSSFQLGFYNFDFTRFVNLPFTSGTGRFLDLFQRIRVGRGRMTIKRVDNGANEAIVVDYTGVSSGNNARAAYPLPPTGRAIPLVLHYMRLKPDESMTSDWAANNNRAFMMSPRKKVRMLWPNRKITFSFVPLMHMEKYQEVTSRTTQTGGSEQPFATRRITLPTRWKKQMK